MTQEHGPRSIAISPICSSARSRAGCGARGQRRRRLPAISVAPDPGQAAAAACAARRRAPILEIGTLGGYSTIWLARALPAGGRLITLEADPKHAEVARANIARAGLADIVERARSGPALDTLPQLAAEGRGPFDLVFIDADKPNTAAYFDWALKLARPRQPDHRRQRRPRRRGDRRRTAPMPTSRACAASTSCSRPSRASSATAIQTVGSKGYDGFAHGAGDFAFVVSLSPWTPRRIGTAYAAAHILPVPLAKPGDSGPTRVRGQRAFHQRWERPVATRPHGSLTSAGESHASVLTSALWGSAHPAGVCPVDRRPHADECGAACCRVANGATSLPIPPPPPADPPEGFTSAETERARIYVEPGGEIDADGFARSWGLLIDDGLGQLEAFLPSLNDKIDIYVYVSDGSYATAIAAARWPEPEATDVLANPGRGDIAVDMIAFARRTPLEAENALRHAMSHVVAGRHPADRSARIRRGVGRLFRTTGGRASGSACGTCAERSCRGRLAVVVGSEPPRCSRHSAAGADGPCLQHGRVSHRPPRASRPREFHCRAGRRARLARRAAHDLQPGTQRVGSAMGRRSTALDYRRLAHEPARGVRSATRADLLELGHYATARRELEQSLRLFTDLGDDEGIAEVGTLLGQTDTGLQAETFMSQAQAALEHHDYDRAQTLLEQARAQYNRLSGAQEPADLLAAYDELTQAGVQAARDLERARQLSLRWADYPVARASALAAELGTLAWATTLEGARRQRCLNPWTPGSAVWSSCLAVWHSSPQRG